MQTSPVSSEAYLSLRAVGSFRYLSYCNKNNSEWVLKHCIVMSLQQVDLCKHSLGAAACWSPASHACIKCKAGRVISVWDNSSFKGFRYLCRDDETTVQCALRPCSNLTVKSFASGLRFWHSSAEPERASPTHFQSKMNVCVNMKVSFFGECCSSMGGRSKQKQCEPLKFKIYCAVTWLFQEWC